MEHKPFREDFMLEALLAILKLHWVDDDVIPYLVDEEGTTFESNDSRVLEVNPILNDLHLIPSRGEEQYIDCDAIRFWGDGCLELHDNYTLQAFHWSEFDEESIIMIEEYLKDLLKKN